MFHPKNLYENIRKFRTKKGISQTELATLLRISPQSVSKWECGVTLPDIENLCLIADALHVSVDMLLGGGSAVRKTMIGVDGGGTKTEFVIFTEDGTILEKMVLGPCNPNAVGLESSFLLLQKGIDSLMENHGGVIGVFIGASGFLTGNNGKKIQRKLRNIYPHIQIQCETDIMNVIAAGTSSDYCTAVICGTGSAVFAKEKEKLTQITGWGYLLSRGGSGYDIGRDALLAALEDAEAIGESTEITSLVEEQLGGSVRNCVSQIYQKDQSYAASFAPLVFAAYERGDKVAAQIMEKNAERLAGEINHAVTHYSCGEQVIISGSILLRSHAYLSMVKESLNPNIDVVIPKIPQVLGACRLCAQMCGVDSSELNDRLGLQYSEGGI